MTNADNLLICLRGIQGHEVVNVFITRLQAGEDEEAERVNLDEIRAYLDNLLRDSTAADQQPHTDEANSACNIDLIHLSLVELAKIFPRNEDDFSGLGVIPEDDLIYTGSGHRFNIHSLVHYHQTRDYRGSTDNELPGEKFLLNPYTNERFHYKDVLHILGFVREKGLTIEGVRISDEGPAVHINPIPPSLPSSPVQQAPDVRSLPRPIPPVARRIPVNLMSPPLPQITDHWLLTRDNLIEHPSTNLRNISLSTRELRLLLSLRHEEARSAVQNAENSIRMLEPPVYSLS